MDNNQSSLYNDIYNSKFFLKASKKSEYEIRLPKSSFDKIITLYGNEKIMPLSFISFCTVVENKETIINMTGSINIRSTLQINKILYSMNNLLIYPASYEGLSENEKIIRSPKLTNKALQNISKKIGMDFSEMINYLSLQIVTVRLKESIRTIKSLEIYLKVFNYIHLLNVKFPNKIKFPITYYSYKSILNMCGITIDKMFGTFDIEQTNNLTRDDLLKNEKSILYNKVLIRELYEGIDDKIKEEQIDVYKGGEHCGRIPKPQFDALEYYRKEESDLLKKLSELPKNKVIDIKNNENSKENENENDINIEKVEENKIKIEKDKEIVNIEKDENKNIEIINIEQKHKNIYEIKEKNQDNNNKDITFQKEKEVDIDEKNNNKKPNILVDKVKEIRSSKVKLDKFVNKHNSLEKRKFKIRRAVFIKVQKEN